MKPFHIEIVTPDGPAYCGEIESLLIRTDDGDVEILAGHADFLSSISTGRARITANGQRRYASVNGGFISVSGSDVRLCTITFEFADQIDLERAKKAKEKAEKALSAAKDQRDELIARAKIARASSRIDIAGLK